MKKNQFLDFLKDNILTLFTGSEIIGEEPSSPRDNCVAQGDSGSIKIKFKRTKISSYCLKKLNPIWKNLLMMPNSALK